jgi:hypothetical protein
MGYGESPCFRAASGDGHGERVERDPGLHPVADRVAHDPVGPDVLDRAEIQLALVRCSEMSINRSWFAWSAVNCRSARSS